MRTSLPVLVPIVFAFAACGGPAGDSAGLVACREACDVQAETCDGFDVDGCDTICDAWALTSEGEGCDALLEAWQDCLAGLDYTCFEDMAVPSDIDTCSDVSSAFLDSDC